MKCEVCGSSEVVMSGVDAYLLEIETERFCYDCANKMYVAKNGVKND